MLAKRKALRGGSQTPQKKVKEEGGANEALSAEKTGKGGHAYINTALAKYDEICQGDEGPVLWILRHIEKQGVEAYCD